MKILSLTPFSLFHSEGANPIIFGERTRERTTRLPSVDGTVVDRISLSVHRSLTPSSDRLSVTPLLRESGCRTLFDLGRSLVSSRECSSRREQTQKFTLESRPAVKLMSELSLELRLCGSMGCGRKDWVSLTQLVSNNKILRFNIPLNNTSLSID